MDNKKIIEQLRAWGCDVNGALERFMDDEEQYVDCIQIVLEDDCFVALGKAIKEKNVTATFENAHTLKGVLANMGLTPMFEIAEKIVEPARIGKMENLMEFYGQLLDAKNILADIYENNK